LFLCDINNISFYLLIYLFNNFQFGEMQLGELQFGEMPHFFNTPHAFKKIGEMQSGEMQFGEMPHTLKNLLKIGEFQ